MVEARYAVGAAAVVVLSVCACGQISFVDSSEGAGLESYVMAQGMASGACAADIDGDGDIDLFVPNGAGFGDQMYENVGGGAFVEIAGGLGLASTENHRGALLFDYDGDHDLDLLTVEDQFGLGSGAPTTLRLWRREGDGSYTEVTSGAGLWGALYAGASPFATHVGGAAAGDLDNDGWLDLVVTFWQPTSFPGAATHVYMNNGDGTFRDVSALCGMNPVGRAHWQPVIHDFDRDGRMDVFVAVDFDENRLWINQGNGLYVDVAGTAGVDNAWNDMGVALGDYDHDGDFDVLVTNVQADEGAGTSYDGRHNVFFRNETAGGAASFVEHSVACGLDDGDWGWGVTFLDADCDGWLDVAQTNGFNEPGYQQDPSRLFRSLGGDPVVFEDVSAAAGMDDTDIASCMIAADVDRDGDLDVVQTTGSLAFDALGIRLYENVTSPRAGSAGAGWLVVRPRMHGTNWFAIGAEVRVRVGDVWRARRISCGTSMLGQEPAEAHFGLGDAAVADEVVVSWPDGRETVLAGVGVNRVVDVELGCRGDLDGDHVTTVFDFGVFATGYGAEGLEAFTGGDMDGDGDVDIRDFRAFADDFGCW